MAIADALIAELEQEAATTRRVLERVPADKLAWKPHDKSMSLGRLALHAGVALHELRAADGAGLEEMFLELTADTQRETTPTRAGAAA